MDIHAAKMGIVPVLADGTVKGPGNSNLSIREVMTKTSEIRVMQNPNIASTTGYPTIANYLKAEANLGFELLHLDQYNIITTNGYNNCADVSVTSTWIKIIEMLAPVSDEALVTLKVGATGNLTGLKVRVAATVAGAAVDYIVDSAFNTPSAILVFVSDNNIHQTLANGTAGFKLAELDSFGRVEIWAKSSNTVSVHVDVGAL